MSTRNGKFTPATQTYLRGIEKHLNRMSPEEIEAMIIVLAQRMFGAEYIEWRPGSTSMANAAVFFALTQPGERIMTQSRKGGGNYSYNDTGTPRLAGLDVSPIPFVQGSFEIDMTATRERARQVRPRMFVVGGEVFESRCQQANILVAQSQHVGETGEGARLTTQEITRQGMREHHMPAIAALIRRAVIDKDPVDSVAADVADFLGGFHRIGFSFDEAVENRKQRIAPK